MENCGVKKNINIRSKDCNKKRLCETRVCSKNNHFEVSKSLETCCDCSGSGSGVDFLITEPTGCQVLGFDDNLEKFVNIDQPYEIDEVKNIKPCGDKNTIDGSGGSTIGGGLVNIITGSGANICCGVDNEVRGDSSSIGGGVGNKVFGVASVICGGRVNEVTGDDCFVSGRENVIVGTESVIGGGRVNVVVGDNSTVGGGKINKISGDSSTIAGGFQNTMTGDLSTISGGGVNQINAESSNICGGVFNTIESLKSSILGGERNKILGAQGSFNSIINGQQNTIENETSQSVIVGGISNTISSNVSNSVILGCNNLTATNDDTTYMCNVNIIGNFDDSVTGEFMARDIATGKVVTPDTSQLATAGDGLAIPTCVQGFLIVRIGGEDKRIPYFNP